MITRVLGEFCQSEIEYLRESDPESPLQIEIYEFHDGGFERLSHKLHPGLSGSTSAFSDVAAAAASHHVGPVIGAALHFRNHMVNGKVPCREIPTAVLAKIRVSDQDILPGKGHFSPVYLADELDESNYCGDSIGSRNGPDCPVRIFDNFHFAVKQENHGALPRNQPHELITGVQDNDGLHCCHLV